MNLKEMKIFIERMEEIMVDAKKDGYDMIKFTCETGGTPYSRKHNGKRLKLSVVSEKTEELYETQLNGMAEYGEVEIICKKTKMYDDNSNNIYIDANGNLFVEKFEIGTPSRFDEVWFEPPTINNKYFYSNNPVFCD
jgi:hypothetical protein